MRNPLPEGKDSRRVSKISRDFIQDIIILPSFLLNFMLPYYALPTFTQDKSFYFILSFLPLLHTHTHNTHAHIMCHTPQHAVDIYLFWVFFPLLFSLARPLKFRVQRLQIYK